MLLLRVLGLLLAIVVGTSVALYVFTGERRWLRIAWNSFRFGLLVAVGVLLLFALERLLVAL